MRKIKALFIVVVMASMLFTACATTEEPVEGIESSINETGDVKAVKITANNAKITQGCDPNSQVLQTANKNANFNVLNKVNNDWYAVQLPNNQIGFVPQGQCTPVIPQTANNQTVAKTPGTGTTTPTPTTPNTGTGKTPTPGTSPGGTTPTPNTGTGAKTPTPDATTPNVNNTGKTTPGANTGTPNADTGTPNKENTTTNQPISNFEQQMINLVNESRKQNGLKALVADNQLSEVARIKSKDMIDKNYFSHNSPTYGSPFDMLKNFNISYLKAGENIAGNQTVERAHEALMNSPGHRQNILSPDYTHIGVGIQEGGNYGNMFTQLFISK